MPFHTRPDVDINMPMPASSPPGICCENTRHMMGIGPKSATCILHSRNRACGHRLTPTVSYWLWVGRYRFSPH